MHVDVQEVQTKIIMLINKAKAGEEILFEESGEVIAKLVPTQRKEKVSDRIGAMAGQIELADDFDAPLTGEEAKVFGFE